MVQGPLQGTDPDPDATVVGPNSGDPDATVVGPAPAADPDATVASPIHGPEKDAAGAAPEPDAEITAPGAVPAYRPEFESAAAAAPASGADPDATVSIPPPAKDAEATVAMPPPSKDPEATVAMPSPAEDPDATVAIPAAGFDADATVAIPSPGRLRTPFAPTAGREAVAADLAELGGLNRLVSAANPILAAVPQIRQALKHPNPAGLRARLREQIENFEAYAGVAGVPEDSLSVARYALCALLDESAARTPWGGDWEKNGFLSELHGERWGGEKFFMLLASMAQDPAANIELLEFFYVCLALGFEGRYRVVEDGRQQLAEVVAKLHELLRRERPRADAELSARWRGVLAYRRRVPETLAFLGVIGAVALVLVVLYVGYSLSLGSLSDPVARDLARLKAPAVAVAAGGAAAVPAGPKTSLAPHLADEIQRGLIAVTEDARGSTVVIRADRVFASGSARVDPEVQPIILRIAEALERVPGSILVIGHSDDVPIRSARFPSNWELSTERARTVVKLIAARLGDPGRLRAEGLADSEPVAPNDSEANRARNRRVVIILRLAT